MIEKLTAKQEKMMIEFREHWLKKGLSTDTVNREKTKSAVTHLYGKIGKKPPVFIFCDSPLEANLTINIFRMGIPDRILAELGADLREKLGHELGDRLRDKLWLETWEGLGEGLGAKLWGELKNRLEADLEAKLWGELKNRLGADLEAELWDKLGGELWNKLDQDLLGGKLGGKLRADLWDKLGGNLRDKLGDELGGELGGKVSGELSFKLGADLRRELRNKLGEYNATGLLGSLDAYWIAYYQFMPQIGIAYDARHQELLDVWTALAESSFWWWPYENYCFVSDRPKKLSFNSDSRLHDEHGPAFEFRDGWKGYYLNGVNFPENLYKRVIAGELTMADIQSIENIEQRMQAIKHAKNGVRDFFVSQNGILRDKVVKKDIKNREVNYELWEIPAGGIFGENVFFAFYDDPSSLERKQKREYMKGVPPCETIAEAMAWGMSDDTHVLSPEDWLALVPLAEES
jgi:hypothetical protein